MVNLEYLTDKDGQLKAVVIPIEFWRKLFPKANVSSEELMEAIENYCLNQAMEEAKASPLLNREEALAFLES